MYFKYTNHNEDIIVAISGTCFKKCICASNTENLCMKNRGTLHCVPLILLTALEKYWRHTADVYLQI